MLRLTAGSGDSSSRDTLTVVVRPDDPPIGVPLVTLSEDPAAGVWIDGKPVPNVFDRNGIFVVVLERRTRAIVEAGTTPRHGAGISQLLEMADKYGRETDRYLMILASAKGTTADVGGPLRKLFGKLGIANVSDGQLDAITAGTPFSLVAIPGGLPGSAWTKLPPRGAGVAAASIVANLQLNQATVGVAPKHYDVAPLDHPTYDTRVGTPGATSNTIRWNGRDYTKTLPPSATAGFHTLIVDPCTGAVLDENPLTSNGNDTNNQVKVAADWLKGQLDRKPAPLVIMQSIGSPSARANSWNALADQMVRLGANRYVLNALDGSTDSYALVGRPGAEAPAAEVEHRDRRGRVAERRHLARPHAAADGGRRRPVRRPQHRAGRRRLPESAAVPGVHGRREGSRDVDRNQDRLLQDGRRQLRDAPPLLRELRLRELDAEVDRPRQIDLAWRRQRLQRGRVQNGQGAARRGDLRGRQRRALVLDAAGAVRPHRRQEHPRPQRPRRHAARRVAAPTGDATTSWALGLVSEIAGVGGAVESSVSGRAGARCRPSSRSPPT